MRSHHSSSRQPEISTATHNFRNASPKATFYIPHVAPTSVSHHGTPQNNTAQTFYLGHERSDAGMNVNVQLFNANDKSAGSQRGTRHHKRNYSDSTNNNSLVNRLADYSHRVLPENSQEARSRRHQDHGTLDDNALRLRQFPPNVEDKNSHHRHVEYNSGRNPVKPVLNIDFSSVINKHNEEVPLDHKLNKSSHGSKVSLTHELDKENQPVKANKSSSHDHAKASSKLYKTTNPSPALPKYGESSYSSVPKRDSYINDYEPAYSSPQNQFSSYTSNSTRMNEVKASGSQQLTSDIRSTSRASMMRADDMGQLLSDTTAKRSQNSDSYSFKDIKKHVANYGMPVKIGLDLAGYANSTNHNDIVHHDKSSHNNNVKGNIGEGFENDMSLVNFGTDADIVPQPVQIVPQLKSSTNKVSVYSSLHGHEDSQTKDSLSAFDKTGYIARHSHLSMNNRRSDQSDEKFNATAPHSRAVHSKRDRDEHPKRHQEDAHMEVERYRKDMDGRKSDPVKAEKKLHDLLNPSRRHDERNSSESRHKRSKSTTAKLRSHSKIVNQKKSFAEDFFVSIVERNKSAGYEGECVSGSRDSLKLTPLKDELILAALHENKERKSKRRSDELIQISHILQHASTPEYTKHNITSSSRHHHHAHKDQLLSGSSSIKGDKTMDAIFKRDESGMTKTSHQEMKENYKKSMRSHERKSHADAQTDKTNLKRIASQPEELKKFAMQLVREKMQENKKDNKPGTPLDSKQKYEADKMRKQSRDFQDRSTPQSVKHAKAVPFALFDLGRKENEAPKEEVRQNKHAGIETYSIVDKNSEERNRYRSREDKSKDKDRKSQEAGMSKTYKKDMQIDNMSKAAYSSVGSSKREVKMSPRVRQENNYVSKHDSGSHVSHSKKEMSDSRKGPVDSTRDKENIYRHSKTDSVHKKSNSRTHGERNNKHKEEPLMPTNISYLLSSEHNTSMGNLFNCEATILDRNPLSEFTETEDLPSKWLGDKLLVPEDPLLDLAAHTKSKQAMTPSSSQAKIVPHHTKQKSVGDHVSLQKHSTRDINKGGRYSYQDPESSNRREESGSQTRHVEPRVVETQAPTRPVIVKDGWLGGPIGAEETPRYQASQRERHEEKINNHYSYDKQYASTGGYKDVPKSNKGTPKVDVLSQISKNTRDQKPPGMPPKSGQNQASQANISCAMDYQSNDVYVARREKDHELAKKFDEFKAKEMSNQAGLKERRTSREEKPNKYGGVGKHGLQELNSYDSTPFLLANFDNYMSNTSQREHLVMTGRTVPHVASHQGTVQKRPNYQLQIPSAERYLDAGVTGKRDTHVKPHVEHEKHVREESKSGYTQTTRYKPDGDIFDDSFLQHSFKPTSKDFDGPTSNMPSHRKEDLLEGICHLSAIHPLSDEDQLEISEKRPDSRYASKERKQESRKPKQIEVMNPSHESYSQQSRRKNDSEKYIDLVRMTSPKENAGVFAKPQDRQNEVNVVPKITDRLDDKLSPKVRLFDNFSGGTMREKRIPQYEKAQKAMHISAVSTPKEAEGSMRRERFIKDKTGLEVFTIGRVGASTGRNRSRHDISIKSPMGMSAKDSILYDQSNHSQTQKNSSVIKKNTVGFSRPSNKQMIKNALNHVCLAGEVNRREREEVGARIDEDKDRNNFIIVFKDLSGRQDLRALYSFDTTSGFTRKLYANGSAPVQLEESMISAYYRYDSGAREFKLIPDNKTLSIVVDAVSLHPYMSRKISQ